MKFQVPKFLEREAKFFGFVTFKQLALLGAIGLILFILYYVVPKSIFFSLIIFVGGVATALIMIRIESIPLYQLAGRLFGYLVSPKKFLWQKEETPLIKLLKREKEVKKEEGKKEKTHLRIFSESKLKRLSSKIEMGIR